MKKSTKSKKRTNRTRPLPPPRLQGPGVLGDIRTGGGTIRRPRAARSCAPHRSVVVLATIDEAKTRRVLLERQYRHAADSYLWELPAGRIDQGREGLAAGQARSCWRKQAIEQDWKKILKFYASPGFVAEPMTVFWAREPDAGPGQPEADEVIEQRLVPLSKAVQMVRTRDDPRRQNHLRGALAWPLHQTTPKARK